MQKRRFNFAEKWKEATGQKIMSNRTRRGMTAVLTVTLLLLAVLLAMPWLGEIKLAGDLNGIEERIAGYQETASALAETDKLENEVKGMNDFLDLTRKKSADSVRKLQLIQNILPKDAVMSAYTFKPDGLVQATVFLPDPIDIDSFQKGLRDSGLFEQIDLKQDALLTNGRQLVLVLKMKG